MQTQTQMQTKMRMHIVMQTTKMELQEHMPMRLRWEEWEEGYTPVTGLRGTVRKVM